MPIFGLGRKNSRLIGPTLLGLYRILPEEGWADLTKLLSGAPSGSEVLAFHIGPDVDAFTRLPGIIKKMHPKVGVIDVLGLKDGGVLFAKGDATPDEFTEVVNGIGSMYKVIFQKDLLMTSARYDASELKEPPKKGDVLPQPENLPDTAPVQDENAAIERRGEKAAAVAESYIEREHPLDATERMLGLPHTRPTYSVVSNQIGRSSYPHIDMKIVSIASCLPAENVAANDTQKIAAMALAAIEHYASLLPVRGFFLLPYIYRGGDVSAGLSLAEVCRVYAGVESLLLEIYDELPQNGTITDEIVMEKVRQLSKPA